jgi:hypothetical protein
MLATAESTKSRERPTISTSYPIRRRQPASRSGLRRIVSCVVVVERLQSPVLAPKIRKDFGSAVSVLWFRAGVWGEEHRGRGPSHAAMAEGRYQRCYKLSSPSARSAKDLKRGCRDPYPDQGCRGEGGGGDGVEGQDGRCNLAGPTWTAARP